MGESVTMPIHMTANQPILTTADRVGRDVAVSAGHLPGRSSSDELSSTESKSDKSRELSESHCCAVRCLSED